MHTYTDTYRRKYHIYIDYIYRGTEKGKIKISRRQNCASGQVIRKLSFFNKGVS